MGLRDINGLQEKAKLHKVKHSFSGKSHFFEVESESGQKYSVSVKVACDCKYMSVQGIANGGICSHILAVFKYLVENEGFNKRKGE